MEWKVGNALSRDVERQHLNKILADIRTTINQLPTTGSSSGGGTNTVNTITRYAVARFTLTLEGGVTGSALVDGLSDVTIETALNTDDLGLVEEAPIDNQYYSRWNGEWKVHSGLEEPEGLGILVQIENEDYEHETVVREIEVVTGELTVADGNGVAGNPTLGLEDTTVTPGEYTNAYIEVDAKGRITYAEDGVPSIDAPSVMARISIGF